MDKQNKKYPLSVLVLAIIFSLLIGFIRGYFKNSDAFPKPDKGIISGSTYSNEFFGFSFSLPSKWHIFSDAEIKAPQDGINITPKTPQFQSIMPGALMLILISKYSPEHIGLNPNLNIIADDITPYLKEVNDSFTYLHSYSKVSKERQEAQIIGEIKAVTLGGKQFHVLNTKWPDEHHQRMFVAIIKNHALIITLNAENNSTLEELTNIIENITFKE